MPMLLKTTNDKREMLAGPPFGPGVAREIAERAAVLEVWGSRYDDPGPDWCEFVLKDATGVVIDRKRVAGY